MSYFPPYIDASGVHMPTYEDRLEDLVSAYRNIFGVEAELSAAVPDYQLLSVFAKALDDAAALVLQDYSSRNPMYASGNALDLLLPQYGIAREAGESDASVRARIRHALAARGAGSYDALLAAVKSARAVKDAIVHVNETDSTDAEGVPAHSIAVVTRSGYTDAVAQAIWDHKPPGIGLYGSVTGTALDAEGNPHSVRFSRYTDQMIEAYLFITVLPGGDRQAIEDAVRPAVLAFVDGLRIGEPLNVPRLYGVAYATDPAIADTFVITDIQTTAPGVASVIRSVIPCEWNQLLTLHPDSVTVYWS